MKIKGKGFQHCVKYEFQPRKVNRFFLLFFCFVCIVYNIILLRQWPLEIEWLMENDCDENVITKAFDAQSMQPKVI